MAAKSCPYCGQQVKSTAVKCRYCGEFLKELKPKVVRAQGRLTVVECILATIFFPVGMALGLVWMSRKTPKGRPLTAVSLFSAVLVAATCYSWWMLRPRGDLPAAPTGELIQNTGGG